MKYDFDEIIGNAKKGRYKQLGSGSCRMVFDLGDGYVVKIAKDIRGTEQNQNEYVIYKSHQSVFFAEIADISPDSKLLVMAKAKKIRNLSTVYQFYNVHNINSLLKLNNFYKDVNAYKLSRGDLIRPSSWGVVNNAPVLIDYGLTHDMYMKYYRRNPFMKKWFAPIYY